MSEFNERILEFLICPKTGNELFYDKKKKILHTADKKNAYEILNGTPILTIDKK